MGAGLQRAVAAAKATTEKPTRTVNVPKILCHSDGAVFCVWNPGEEEVYASFFCCQDTPPAPESLKINMGRLTFTAIASLVWRPVIQVVQVGEPGNVDVQGPYDDHTGERV